MMKPIVWGTLLIAAVPAFAGTITLNLNGVANSNGTPLTFSLSPDPGPDGFSSALTYDLPFTGTQGDVLVFNPNLGFPGDILRFNGNGTLVVYSNDANGINSLAATSSPPGSLYPNTIVINATGPQSNLIATYTPHAGDPGFDSSAPTYVLNASSVPEPGTLSLLGIAFALFGFAGCRKKLRQA